MSRKGWKMMQRVGRPRLVDGEAAARVEAEEALEQPHVRRRGTSVPVAGRRRHRARGHGGGDWSVSCQNKTLFTTRRKTCNNKASQKMKKPSKEGLSWGYCGTRRGTAPLAERLDGLAARLLGQERARLGVGNCGNLQGSQRG